MENKFAQLIEVWYGANGRDLPWRATCDPYHIWISEIILQQTRVVQGMAYFARFIETFPTVEALSQASEDQVLRLWQGLGYYSRARNLHAASRQIVQMGGFPDTREGLLSLKGVGEYTAAAIGSIAFGLPLAVLDGNVYRVLSRYFGIDTPIDTTEGKKLFTQLSQQLLDRDAPALYNQAIMDFGAMVCMPQSAHCSECPLADSCQALASNKVCDLPIKSRSIRVRTRYFNYVCVCNDTHLLLQRRNGGDIWEGLYQVPMIETSECASVDMLMRTDWFAHLMQDGSVLSLCQSGVKHQLTHQTIVAEFYKLMINDVADLPDALSGCIWVEWTELDKYAMPRLLLSLMR